MPATRPDTASRPKCDRPTRKLPAAALSVLLGLAASFGAALPAQAAEQNAVKLLAFGDSLVHGYGLPAGETFPEQLQTALRAQGYRVEVMNGGNSGDTTASGLSRLDWALSDNPDVVLIALGGNDMLRGLEPSETYRNLDAILQRLEQERLPVLLTGMLAQRNLGPEYAAEFDAIFPKLAEEHSVAFYPFFLDGVATDPALNQPDGLHPNGQGVNVIVERILPALRPLIEAASNMSSDG